MSIQTTFIGKDEKKHTMITQWYPGVGGTYCIIDNNPGAQMGIKMPEVKFHLKVRKDHKWFKENSTEIPEKPKEIKSIWDNGGKTADRFTVILKSHYSSDNKNTFDALGLSENPTNPSMGFSQFTEATPGEHLGKKIQWHDLPIEVIRHIAIRLQKDEWPKHREPKNNF